MTKKTFSNAMTPAWPLDHPRQQGLGLLRPPARLPVSPSICLRHLREPATGGLVVHGDVRPKRLSALLA